jgi:AcrR family transcriptional regulator
MPNPDTHPRPSPRDRILDTASELFYRDGVRAVGVDRVIAESGVAKMTLYNHFGSKDALIAAWLRRRDAEWMAWLEQRVEANGGDLAAVFDALAEWFRTPDFRGCAFINTRAELGSSNQDAADAVVAHKKALLDLLERVARGSGADDPAAVAAELLVLVDGAIVTASIGSERAPAAIAKRAALRLVRSH